MSELTADQLAHRIYECRLMELELLQQILGDSSVDGAADLETFKDQLLRHEHLTNWQLQRVLEGHIHGYFYGNWKALYLIGAGTFARVYRSVHIKTGDVKATKVLRSRYSENEDMREQFLREAKMVMKLRHPNIVPIQEVETERGRLYMVMDFVEGQNLRDYVKAHKKLSPIRSLKIISDLAAGLAYAAELGIGHRDMKLSNVLLSAKGQAKLVDFGLATVSGDEQESAGGAPRSIDYAGLERVTGADRDDPRSDLYFLGCMLYHMVCGHPALEETKERMRRIAAQRYTDVVPIAIHDPELPHRLVVFINRLMDLKIENRIQTAKDAHREAENVMAQLIAGDTTKYDAALTDQDAAAYAEKVATKAEGEDKTVLLIESNLTLQDLLRSKLKEIGYRVLITSDPARGLERFEDYEPGEALPVDCIIFGTVGLGRRGLKTYRDFILADNTKNVPALLIIVENLEKFVQRSWLDDQHMAFKMPLKFKHVQRALRKLLSIEVAD
jgi:tRNA A-37 threonylcarbamoyl transferase component Bud32/CheY-like chemotaxis protein